jgi:undecaprenyl-diphosphatase
LNDYLISLLLGIVEGITEFLPVSSTAHLRVAESLLNVSLTDGYWKTYTIVIQFGAILCLPVYFRNRILAFVKDFPRGSRGTGSLITHPAGLVGAAFVSTVVPAYLLTKVIGKNLENLYVMGGALLIGGVAMWIVDAMNAASEAAGPGAPGSRIRTWTMEEITPVQAVWIGCCQVLSAVFPGTSRSMATIASGQLAGVSRSAALEFSFFLSMPTMAAATGYDLLKALASGPDANPLGATRIDAHGWSVLAIGFVVSFLVSYVSVAWLMNWVRRGGFVPFAVYRILAGAGVLAWVYMSGR